MRLIDADAFKEQVIGAALVNGTSEAGEKAETMVKLIDSQSTAYDVNKVEQELKNEIELVVQEYPLHGKYIKKSRAIDIVRSGGVTPEKPQSKDGKYMTDREEFFREG